MCYFFSGLEDGSKLHLNACSGGAFLELSTKRCTKILEGIANNLSDLDIGRGSNQRVAQIEESEVLRKLLERVNMLENAKVVSFQQRPPPLFEDPNQYMNQIPQSMEEVNFMGRQGYQGQHGNYGGGSSYNPNARKHENFSYSNPKAAVQFPPGFEPGAKPPNNEGRPSTDEMLSLIYKEMKEKDAKVDEYMKSTSSQIKNIEFQMGQLATTIGHMQNKGKFPSTTEPNPKEHCKAIELRSGTRYQGPPLPNEHDEEKKKDEIEQENEDDKVSEKYEYEEIAPLREDE
ncbi:hypothetical protein ACS0TY_014311 [Phlomoides rotata]